MRCSKARNRLTSLLSNELTESEKRQVMDHLQRCDNCQADYNLLLKTYSFLRKWKSVEVSSDFSQKLYQKTASLNSDSALSRPISAFQDLSRWVWLFPREIFVRATLAFLLILFVWAHLDSWTFLTYRYPVGKWPGSKYRLIEEVDFSYQFLEIGFKEESGTIILKARIGS